METLTSTVADVPGIVAAFEAGNIGLAIGLILLAVVGTARRLRLPTVVDGVAGVIVTAATVGLGIVGAELVAGASWLTVALAAIQGVAPVLAALFIPARDR